MLNLNLQWRWWRSLATSRHVELFKIGSGIRTWNLIISPLQRQPPGQIELQMWQQFGIIEVNRSSSSSSSSPSSSLSTSSPSSTSSSSSSSSTSSSSSPCFPSVWSIVWINSYRGFVSIIWNVTRQWWNYQRNQRCHHNHHYHNHCYHHYHNHHHHHHHHHHGESRIRPHRFINKRRMIYAKKQ